MENFGHHYAQLLGLQSPWEVTDVDLDFEGSRVTVRLEHPNGVSVRCPECGGECTIVDRAPERRRRQLDTMQFETQLVAATPRADCGDCGVRTISVPWAGKNSRFTLMFKSFALRVIEASGYVEKGDHGARCRERTGAPWSRGDRTRWYQREKLPERAQLRLGAQRLGRRQGVRGGGGTGEVPMKKVAEMINSHLPRVLNYFRRRIANPVSEGLDSKIQSIKAMARGFRGFKNYRMRILFFCGKLDMSVSPSTHSILGKTAKVDPTLAHL